MNSEMRSKIIDRLFDANALLSFVAESEENASMARTAKVASEILMEIIGQLDVVGD